MVALAALSMSLSSLFIPDIVSLLSLGSGILAVKAQRYTALAGLALTINFLPLAGIFESGISQDWLVTILGLSPFLLSTSLLVVQIVFLAIVIWKWAFPTETGIEC